MHETMILIAVVLGLGIGAQIVAERLRLPSILLLLSAGLLAGPVMREIAPQIAFNPDELFGDLLTPLVALSVGLILFEGGLTLQFRELKKGARVVWMLVSVGAAVTWVLAGLASYYILGLPWPLAALFGAILTVSGPTVVLPLVRHIRPRGLVGPILKWEGIVIDPIGALAAVLVYEAIVAGTQQAAAVEVVGGVLKTIVAGGGLGFLVGWLISVFFSRFWIPDHLHNPVALAAAVVAFAAADWVQKEAGLLATTVMGVYLANQRRLDVEHILEFKESLRVLLISALFVVLAARLTREDIEMLGWSSVGFVAVLIFVVRPAATYFSTLGSRLKTRERLMVAFLCPRGIVAASIAPVLAFDLQEKGFEEAGQLVPLIFAVIIGTVLFYGLLAGPIARRLKLSDTNPQGVLLLGGHAWSREVAKTLNDLGVRAMVADSNYQNVAAAWMDGVPAYHGDILGESAMDNIELTGIGKFVALTPNDQVNTLASQRVGRLLSRSAIYQLAPRVEAKKDAVSVSTHSEHHEAGGRGRTAFDDEASFAKISRLWANDGRVAIRRVGLEEKLESVVESLGDDAVAMFVLTEAGRLSIVSSKQSGAVEGPAWIIGVMSGENSVPEPRI